MKGLLKILFLAIISSTLALMLTSCNISEIVGNIMGGNSDTDDSADNNDDKDNNDKDNNDSDNNDDTDNNDGDNSDADNPDDENGDNEDDNAYYTVTLDNGTGTALTSVQIKLVDADGKEAAKAIVGMTGERVAGRADFTAITEGSYKIVLTDLKKRAFYYDAENAVIDAENNSVTVKIYEKMPEKIREIMGATLPEFPLLKAPNIDKGFYHGTLSAGMNYFVFDPTADGIYEFSFIAEGVTVSVGNYGIPDYVLSSSEGVFENKISIETPPLTTEGGCPIVIGIEAESRVEGLFEIVRTADLPPRPQYAPWIDVQPTVTLNPFDLPYDNVSLVPVDITDDGLTVVLGSDGYYHIGDENGDVVYLHVAKPMKDGYLDAGFTAITALQNIGCYIYDEEGNFLRKESYNEMILAYGAVSDENTGIYPLTEDLAYMIKSFGEKEGWFNLDNVDNILFGDDRLVINPENAWLFACVTVEDDESIGTTAENPLELYSEGKVNAKSGATYYFNVYGDSYTVTISGGAEDIVVYANGEEYTAVNGVIQFTLNSGVTTFSITANEDTLITYTAGA